MFIATGLQVHENSNKKLILLRMARAYVDLLCAWEDDPKAQISISRIDDHEIRMFLGFSAEADDEPLFWMELFDHGTRASLNSYACRELAGGADVFEEFRSAAEFTEAGRCPAGGKRYRSPSPDDCS